MPEEPGHNYAVCSGNNFAETKLGFTTDDDPFQYIHKNYSRTMVPLNIRSVLSVPLARYGEKTLFAALDEHRLDPKHEVFNLRDEQLADGMSAVIAVIDALRVVNKSLLAAHLVTSEMFEEVKERKKRERKEAKKAKKACANDVTKVDDEDVLARRAARLEERKLEKQAERKRQKKQKQQEKVLKDAQENELRLQNLAQKEAVKEQTLRGNLDRLLASDFEFRAGAEIETRRFSDIYKRKFLHSVRQCQINAVMAEKGIVTRQSSSFEKRSMAFQSLALKA